MKKWGAILGIVTIGIIIWGCEVKTPTSPPKWFVTLRAPAGDTTLTMIDLINEKPEVLFSRGDSVFYGEDTILTDVPLTVNFPVTVQFSHDLPDVLDSTETTLNSYVTVIRAGGRFKGHVYRQINAYMYTRLVQRDGTVREDTFGFSLDTGYVDTTIIFEYNDFPLGQFVVDITIDTTSGYVIFDTLHVFYEIPFTARFLGDTLVTVLQDVEIDSSIQEAVKEDRVKEIRLHLDLWNRLPVGLTYTFSIFNMDTSKEYVLFENKEIAPAPTSDGFTTGDETYNSIDLVVDDSLLSFFEDSLVYWKAVVLIPEREDTIMIMRDDYIRMRGSIEATVLVDFDEEEGGEAQ